MLTALARPLSEVNSMNVLLLLLRSSLAMKLLKGKPLLWLDRKVSQDYVTNTSLLLGSLINSRSPRYSDRLLTCLAVIPKDVLESHASLRTYFLGSHLPSSSVYEAIKICQEAIRLCFSAK